MEELKVYNDGKVCRDYPAKIIKRKGKRILIEFGGYACDSLSDWLYPIKSAHWFNRRDRKGVYECGSWNFWFFDFKLESKE